MPLSIVGNKLVSCGIDLCGVDELCRISFRKGGRQNDIYMYILCSNGPGMGGGGKGMLCNSTPTEGVGACSPRKIFEF